MHIEELLETMPWANVYVHKEADVERAEKQLLEMWDSPCLTYEHPQGSSDTRSRVEKVAWSECIAEESDIMCSRALSPAARWVQFCSLPSLVALAEEVLLMYILDGFSREEVVTDPEHPYRMHLESARRKQKPSRGDTYTRCTNFDVKCMVLAMDERFKQQRKPVANFTQEGSAKKCVLCLLIHVLHSP